MASFVFDHALLSSVSDVLTVLQLLLHLIFAGAVAQDAGHIAKISGKPILVSPLTWAFATLLGGVMVAAVYWFLHHAKFTQNND